MRHETAVALASVGCTAAEHQEEFTDANKEVLDPGFGRAGIVFVRLIGFKLAFSKRCGTLASKCWP